MMSDGFSCLRFAHLRRRLCISTGSLAATISVFLSAFRITVFLLGFVLVVYVYVKQYTATLSKNQGVNVIFFGFFSFLSLKM